MTPARMLSELEALAWRLGIAVRVEPFETHLSEMTGGLCRVRGQPLVLINELLPLVGRIGVLAAALAHFDLEGVYLSPLVRARIDEHTPPTRATPTRHRARESRLRPQIRERHK